MVLRSQGRVRDSAVDQCHYWCQEMVITAQQIYCLGQSKLLSLPLALTAKVFNLSSMSCLLSGLGLGYEQSQNFSLYLFKGMG